MEESWRRPVTILSYEPLAMTLLILAKYSCNKNHQPQTIFVLCLVDKTTVHLQLVPSQTRLDLVSGYQQETFTKNDKFFQKAAFQIISISWH
jgi:hypothetical protein